MKLNLNQKIFAIAMTLSVATGLFTVSLSRIQKGSAEQMLVTNSSGTLEYVDHDSSLLKLDSIFNSHDGRIDIVSGGINTLGVELRDSIDDHRTILDAHRDSINDLRTAVDAASGGGGSSATIITQSSAGWNCQAGTVTYTLSTPGNYEFRLGAKPTCGFDWDPNIWINFDPEPGNTITIWRFYTGDGFTAQILQSNVYFTTSGQPTGTNTSWSDLTSSAYRKFTMEYMGATGSNKYWFLSEQSSTQ